jgi:GMP synthase-like glutamine amidotransferase
MHLLWYQHVAYEGLGNIESWAETRGHRLTCHAWFENSTAPPQEDVDGLILMGGPMSVHDTRSHPWLVAEKESLHDALKTDKPILGICLGAQLIAEALGATVIENPHRELGWYPVHRHPECQFDPCFSVLPNSFPVFHWHGETFTLPHPAIPLGHSEACTHQGFHAPSGRIGLQFHLELGEAEIRRLIDGGHLPEWQGPHVQPAHECLRLARENGESTQALLFALLDCWSRSGSAESN